MVRRIEKSIGLGDRHPLFGLSDFDDVVTGADFTFLKNPKVEPRTSA